jgi:glycine betaine/proline transport system ATP-binding protein
MAPLVESIGVSSPMGMRYAMTQFQGMGTTAANSPEPKICIQRLLQIFGDRSGEARRLVAQGASSEDIRARTGAVVAVRDVDLTIAAGEIFVVMGLSGSGKSTLVRCINQLIAPTAGTVLLDGENMLSFSREQRLEVRRRKISMVFQNFGLLSHRTVLQNVEYGLAIRGEERHQRAERARYSLQMVGLEKWADQFPDELSGGMRQRVGLARALAADPDVLLMDEPFSALDPLIRRNLQDELLRLQERLHKTIVFVTHDFHEAVKLGDSIAVMRDGQVVQTGTPRQLILSPVNEYIENFTRDIDISQALSVGDVAEFAAAAGRSNLGATGEKVSVAYDAPLWHLYPIVATGTTAVVRDKDGAEFLITSRDVLDCLMNHQSKRREKGPGDIDG